MNGYLQDTITTQTTTFDFDDDISLSPYHATHVIYSWRNAIIQLSLCLPVIILINRLPKELVYFLLMDYMSKSLGQKKKFSVDLVEINLILTTS